MAHPHDPSLTYIPEPEPLPPSRPSSPPPHHHHSHHNHNHHSKPSSSPPPPPPEWNTLSPPAYALNLLILLLGRTLELLSPLAPYLPTPLQRRRLLARARRRPHLAALFLSVGTMTLIPLLGFAAFALWLVGVVALGATVLVAGILAGVGLAVFLPLTAVAAGAGVLCWLGAIAAYKGAVMAWGFYRSWEETQRLAGELAVKQQQGMKKSDGYAAGEKKHAEKKKSAEGEKVRRAHVKEEKDEEMMEHSVGFGFGGEEVKGGYAGTETPGLSGASSPVHVKVGGGVDDEPVMEPLHVHHGFHDGDRAEDRVGRDIARSLG